MSERKEVAGVKLPALMPFDAADYLYSEETIAEFLAAAAENDSPDVMARAVEAVERARSASEKSGS